jgi:molecular chaperone GrpE
MFFRKKDKSNSMEQEIRSEGTTTSQNPDQTQSPADLSVNETDKKSKKNKTKKESIESELEQKVDELNDKYLRLFAEFDNFRKRSLREKIEMTKFASEETITALLPVIDDFDRAMKSLSNNPEQVSALEGFNLIHLKFRNILEQKGLQAMETIGKDFDTDFHEAITNIPVADENLKGKIIDEAEKGYLLSGKVIRYAKVIVGN